MGKEVNKHIHYYGLDWVRSISAICILLYHYTYRFCEHEVFGVSGLSWIGFKNGCCAIVTFFLLSGIFAENDVAINSRTVGKYYARKFFRLYPTFWLSMAITIVVEWALYPQALVSINDVLLNITMVPGLLGAKPVDGAYWTLQYELIFCLAVGMIKWLNHYMKRDASTVIFLLWTLASVALFYITDSYPSGIVSGMVVLSLSEYIGCFVVGIMIKRLVENKKNILAWLTLGVALSSSMLWLGRIQICFLLISMFLSAYILLNRKSFLNRECRINKVVMCFAGCSYSFYLIHQYVGYSILNFATMHGITSEMVIIIPTCIVLMVSVCVYYLFENQLVKRISRYYGI